MYDLPLESFIHSKGQAFYVEQSIKISDSTINSDRYYCGTCLRFNKFFFEDVRRIGREIGASDDILSLLDLLCEDKSINEFYVGAAKRGDDVFNRLYVGHAHLKNEIDDYQGSGAGFGFEWNIKNPDKYFLKTYDAINTDRIQDVLDIVEDITSSKQMRRLVKNISYHSGYPVITNALSCNCDFLTRKSIDFQTRNKLTLLSLIEYSKDISNIFSISNKKIIKELNLNSSINRLQISCDRDNKNSLNVYFGGRFVYTSKIAINTQETY